MRTRTTAVIVSFHSTSSHIGNTCVELQRAGLQVLVVDNTPAGAHAPLELPPGVDYLPMGMNSGIAHAQNVGISRTLAAGAHAVLLLDQDSLIDAHCVAELVARVTPGVPMVVVPRLMDDETGLEMPAVRLSGSGLPISVYCGDKQQPQRVDVVIASGTIATREVFAITGPMDEELFIDYVDTVWSLRCWRAGLPVFMIPSATMKHRIGSSVRQFGPNQVLIHPPLRCYYQLRNAMLLFRRRRAPLVFALHAVLGLLWSRLLLLLLAKPRLPYLRAYYSESLMDSWAGLEKHQRGFGIFCFSATPDQYTLFALRHSVGR